jgi:IclR family KDG regulon transcriptional repressor
LIIKERSGILSSLKIHPVERTFDFLELLSRKQHGLSLTEIGNRLDLRKSTVSCLLYVLKQRGCIVKSDCGNYHLGLDFIELASLHLNNLELKSSRENGANLGGRR